MLLLLCSWLCLKLKRSSSPFPFHLFLSVLRSSVVNKVLIFSVLTNPLRFLRTLRENDFTSLKSWPPITCFHAKTHLQARLTILGRRVCVHLLYTVQCLLRFLFETGNDTDQSVENTMTIAWEVRIQQNFKDVTCCSMIFGKPPVINTHKIACKTGMN